ncbi:MAG: hypothetical protein WD896_00885 [Parcubacteria group bacterium]
MRRYLAELYKKPDHHKRQFAFLTSSTLTLFIFGVWALATFGTNTGTIAKVEDGKSSKSAPLVVRAGKEVSPFQSVSMSLAASFQALKNSLGELKSGFRNIDLEAEYKEMREGALDIYGQ